MIEVAQDMLGWGLNPVPVDGPTKRPLRKGHPEPWTEDEDLEDYPWDAIGVSTGYASGNLEALDFDVKNDEDPKALMASFTTAAGAELLSRLVVQRTPSGGYHMLYRCDEIESNQKLAKNEEGMATIETRGIGGFIKCAPSEGYQLLKGSLEDIPVITPQERQTLLNAAKLQSKQLHREGSKRVRTEEREYVERFPDYNEDPDIGMALMEDAGWQVHSEDGEWVNYTRPGKDISEGMSAGYNLEGCFLYVFTTSQDAFETERPYANSAILAELKFEGKYKAAYNWLYNEGYGVDQEEDEDIPAQDYLVPEVEENEYLDQVRRGDVQMGLSTGWPDLDDYFRFKRNTLNFGLGYDNVGKSVFMSSMMVSSAMLHGWKWGIIAPENSGGKQRQRLIEAMSGKLYKGIDKEEARRHKAWSRKMFKIVDVTTHLSLEDVINIGKRLYSEHGIDALLIDPYNFFKSDGDYAGTNNLLSEMRVFTENYCSLYVMAHPVTQRGKEFKDQDGYLKAPSKYDIQGGSNFAYRVDDFFILHRVINHSSKLVRSTMQFIVEKVKEWDTGGRPHEKGDYSKLTWAQRNDFWGYWDEDGVNPMYKRKQALAATNKND